MDLCFTQFPSLSKLAPSKAGLDCFFGFEEDDMLLLILLPLLLLLVKLLVLPLLVKLLLLLLLLAKPLDEDEDDLVVDGVTRHMEDLGYFSGE
jgi:hypothetical protein